MKVAIILPTAFITTLPSTPDYNRRIDQFLVGFKRVAEIINKDRNMFDAYWVDNTIESGRVYDKALLATIDSLPNLKGKMGFSENEYGRINKGSGIIADWRKVLPMIVEAQYDYVMHLEPRQEISDFSFVNTFLNAPDTYFKVMPTKIRKWKIFSYTINQFWTGLFTCPPRDLLTYAQVRSPENLARRGVNLETDLYRYAKRKKWQYKTLASLGLRWHDTYKNEYVNI